VKLTAAQFAPLGGSADEFAAFIARKSAKWCIRRGYPICGNN
jgi:hypothetical protein